MDILVEVSKEAVDVSFVVLPEIKDIYVRGRMSATKLSKELGVPAICEHFRESS